MPTYVAFLRAINLGKQRRVPMGKLRDVLTDAGYDDVEIYLKYPNGVAGSKMSTPVFERALGTPGTVRTWRGVTRLGELATSAGSRR